jgi:hypothetical protein
MLPNALQTPQHMRTSVNKKQPLREGCKQDSVPIAMVEVQHTSAIGKSLARVSVWTMGTLAADNSNQDKGAAQIMQRTRSIVLAALVVLALGAITATAAQATEGPFYKVEGARLLVGEKQPLEGKIAKDYVLTAGPVTITCKAQKLKNAELIGSTGANGGSSLETVEFETCAVAGNGANCKLKSPTIPTEPVANTLDFANTARTGIILIFFRPAKGSVFTKIQFANDAECTLPSTSVEGTTAAEAWSGGAAVSVGSEPASAVAGEVNFPVVAITKDFVEVGGTLKEVIPSLKAFGKAASLVGRSEIKITGGKKWCVSTGAAGSKC